MNSANQRVVQARKLTKKQIKDLRAVLVEEKNKLIFNGVYLSDEFNLDADDLSDDVDLANSSLSSSQRLRFRNREVFYANKINEALRRVDREEYGECEECGANIGYHRLIARPTAEQCINCKEENEKSENSSVFGRISKSLDVNKSRAISAKA